MKNYKFLFILVAVATLLTSCYDDSYLDAKLPKNMAYFASLKEYSRTVIVGEGMRFKIGAAMAGVLNNDADRTVNFVLGRTTSFPVGDTTHVILPNNYFNYSSLVGTDGTVQAIIPKGAFIGYFPIVLDSAKFLADPIAFKGKFTLPVKIVKTSLDSINKTNDSITVIVKYMARVDGYYLYKNTIQKSYNGTNVGTPIVENFANESDNSAWRLLTTGPFSVKVTSAIAEKITSGISFGMTVDSNNSVTLQSLPGQVTLTPGATNVYDRKTRDFNLNYSFKKTGNDTLYTVQSNLVFRNRMVDGINQTREYLSKL